MKITRLCLTSLTKLIRIFSGFCESRHSILKRWVYIDALLAELILILLLQRIIFLGRYVTDLKVFEKFSYCTLKFKIVIYS